MIKPIEQIEHMLFRDSAEHVARLVGHTDRDVALEQDELELTPGFHNVALECFRRTLTDGKEWAAVTSENNAVIYSGTAFNEKKGHAEVRALPGNFIDVVLQAYIGKPYSSHMHTHPSATQMYPKLLDPRAFISFTYKTDKYKLDNPASIKYYDFLGSAFSYPDLDSASGLRRSMRSFMLASTSGLRYCIFERDTLPFTGFFAPGLRQYKSNLSKGLLEFRIALSKGATEEEIRQHYLNQELTLAHFASNIGAVTYVNDDVFDKKLRKVKP